MKPSETEAEIRFYGTLSSFTQILQSSGFKYCMESIQMTEPKKNMIKKYVRQKKGTYLWRSMIFRKDGSSTIIVVGFDNLGVLIPTRNQEYAEVERKRIKGNKASGAMKKMYQESRK